MAEFTLGGVHYRTRMLNAYDQWRLLNRVRPILPALTGINLGGETDADIASVIANLEPLARSSDTDVIYVFRAAQDACEQRSETGWEALSAAPGMANLMRLVLLVVQENFGSFMSMPRPEFRSIGYDGPVYDPVSMPDDEDWLFRPVLRQMCRAESLYDGTLRIEHIAKLNDLLSVADENEARARKALKGR